MVPNWKKYINSDVKFKEDPFYVEIRQKEDHKIAKKATKYDLSLHIWLLPNKKQDHLGDFSTPR